MAGKYLRRFVFFLAFFFLLAGMELAAFFLFLILILGRVGVFY